MLFNAVQRRRDRWSHRMVSRIFSEVTSGHCVRLDFADGEHTVLGKDCSEVQVAIRPPTLWRSLWILLKPGLRAGEAYVRDYWSVTHGDLATFLRIVQAPRSNMYARLYGKISDLRGPVFQLRQRLLTEWNRRRAPEHYDAGNVFYERILDPAKQYSCAFYSLAATQDLDEAQHTKMAVTIDRLHLDGNGQAVLDIGCGWGSLAAEIAKVSGGHQVVGITLSREQLEGAQALRSSLPDEVRSRLSYRLEDYRHFLADPTRRFDRIVSVGMFEHVGLGRHRHFFEAVYRGLVPSGRALIHSIVRPSPGAYNEWIRRHVFPGSFLPSVAEFIAAAEKSGLIVDAVHIHPPSDYRRTIQAWRKRFEANWSEIRKADPGRYTPTFLRTWTFYLASVETIFSEDLMNFRIAQIELRRL